MKTRYDVVSSRVERGVLIIVYKEDNNHYKPILDTGMGIIYLPIETNTIPGCYAAAQHYIERNAVEGCVEEMDLPTEKKRGVPDQLIYVLILSFFGFFTGFFAAYWILANQFQLACAISLLCALVFFFEYKKHYIK